MSVLLLLAAMTALQTAPAAAHKEAPKKEQKPKLVCQMHEVTGSRFPKKVCATQEEIDERREKDMQSAAEIINRPRINPD